MCTLRSGFPSFIETGGGKVFGIRKVARHAGMLVSSLEGLKARDALNDNELVGYLKALRDVIDRLLKRALDRAQFLGA